MDAALDSTAVRRPNFVTTQWGLVATASAEGTTEARAALDGLYRRAATEQKSIPLARRAETSYAEYRKRKASV